MKWNPLVPELVVNSYEISKKFYVEIFGFNLSFERLEDRFGYFDLSGAQIMLLQKPGASSQISRTETNGKGVHFQIDLSSISDLISRLENASIPLASEITEEWYRAGEVTHGQREFFVADPDGYLYRFFEYIGERNA